MAISKDQIIEAAEALVSEGINPSMQSVRERLGGGSFATISPVLRKWKEDRESTTVAVLEMPSDVKSALERFGVDLWKAASSLASAQFEKLKEESRSSIDRANNERDEALREIELLESQVMLRDDQMASFHDENDLLRSQLNEESNKNIALQQRVTDLQETIANLKSDLKECRQDGRQAVEKLDALHQEQVELSRTNGELTAKVEALDKELVAMNEARMKKDK